MEFWIATIVAVVSAAAAVISAQRARTANENAERIYTDAKHLFELQPKRDVLRRYVGSLHYAAKELAKHQQRVDLAAALNEAVAAFGDDKDVANALRGLKDGQKRPEDHLPVIKAMAAGAQLPLDEFDDPFLLKPFFI